MCCEVKQPCLLMFKDFFCLIYNVSEYTPLCYALSFNDNMFTRAKTDDYIVTTTAYCYRFSTFLHNSNHNLT